MNNDFILIPVILGPQNKQDMWIRAAKVDAFQPAGPNPLGIRTFVRLDRTQDLIPTSDSCAMLLGKLNGEEVAATDNIILFPAPTDGPPRGGLRLSQLFPLHDKGDDTPPDNPEPPKDNA